MFKGLRTKIESEQRGQSNNKTGGQPARVNGGVSTTRNVTISPTNTNTATDFVSFQLKSNTLDDNLIKLQDSIKISDNTKPHTSSRPHSPYQHSSFQEHTSAQQESIEDLKRQVSKLNAQIDSLLKEKNDSDEQNAKLYDIIEKLRRNLENEKETNSSLQVKLNEVESKLTEKDGTKSNNSKTSSISIKSFNPDDFKTADSDVSSDVDVLRKELLELQGQISKKNRQLKIRQQNLNDMKRALQKEMLEHGKTQNELNKIQIQLKEREVPAQQVNNNINNKTDSFKLNGSNQIETSDKATKSHDLDQNLSDKNPEINLMAAGGEDTISLNAIGVSQLDRISCLSRSSASVEDFESNDLQQSSYNREVSHEYLRNVLYRYMTSTDTETTQHLIKAISVLMNFTPEQSAAIKSAMQNRSSWLRLK